MNENAKGLIAAAVVICGLAAALWYMHSERSVPNESGSNARIAANDGDITATFNCTDGRSITAVFSTDEVRLALSDGREMSLPRALSADGARYANQDESLVFWNKGNTAFIQENGKDTYTGCSTQN